MKIQALFLSSLCLCVWCGAVTAQNRVAPVQMTPPGETGRRITDDGLLGNYFPARQRGPAVLMLGGSAGGLVPETNRAAMALQGEGFSAFHLSYFRAPGQNPRVELIPLEYFSKALAWLRRQPEVDPARVAIIGSSKGSEAALLVATRDPQLKAVIAALPTSVVWPGIVWEGSPVGVGSSWSEGGAPLPHLPHVAYDASKGGTMADNYAVSLKAFAQHPEAMIPVENIRGAVMLVCAEADQMWPSCPMARQLEQRLRAHGRPAPMLLAYRDSGHAAFGLPLPEGDPRLTGGGGSPQATNAARADSWPKAVAFLKANVAQGR
jgi:uncharacterized protein